MKYAISVYILAMIFSFSVPEGNQKSNEINQRDSLEADWEKHISQIREEMGEQLELPTDSVFENIKMLNGMPAKRLLAVMKFGYSRSLGVGCGHCHNTNDWASEEKPQKQVTREMSQLMRTITGDLLANIDGLRSEQPSVNCTTCHRGQVKPALNME